MKSLFDIVLIHSFDPFVSLCKLMSHHYCLYSLTYYMLYCLTRTQWSSMEDMHFVAGHCALTHRHFPLSPVTPVDCWAVWVLSPHPVSRSTVSHALVVLHCRTALVPCYLGTLCVGGRRVGGRLVAALAPLWGAATLALFMSVRTPRADFCLPLGVHVGLRLSGSLVSIG